MDNNSPTFAIVEQAGYVGERDVKTGIASRLTADTELGRLYSTEEAQDLHVEIRADFPNGSSTYEC